jgi:hypothetical protein
VGVRIGVGFLRSAPEPDLLAWGKVLLGWGLGMYVESKKIFIAGRRSSADRFDENDCVSSEG